MNTKATVSASLLLAIVLPAVSSARPQQMHQSHDNVLASDPYSQPPAEKDEGPPTPKRIEFDVGMLLGGLDLGTTRADATGLVVNAGMRVGEFSVLGELNYFGIEALERGTMTRAGLTTRYSLVPIGGEKSVATSDIWLEAGAGWEHIAWRSGGVLDRPDLALGVGWQANIVMDKDTANPRYLGPYFSLRTMIAPGPESNREATCGGPCDRATSPSNTDVSVMFQMGLNWGRKSF